MQEELKDVLGRFVEESTYSAGQLQKLTGVSRRTILNWLEGRVQKPHKWHGLVQVATAMNLSEAEADELLQAAQHPPIADLRHDTTDEDELSLLLFWQNSEDVPFDAIADLPYFAGRQEEIAKLSQLLDEGQQVSICSLRGMGGVGKTSLAAHLAYGLRSRFPDGVLWARLDTSDSMSILYSFAAAYGEDVSHYHDLESRAAAVRRILAEKRALLILDNAEASKQVRPLLPPTTGNTAVIITTRQELSVTDDMHRFLLEPFTAEGGEAISIFTHFLGQRVVNRWYEQLQTIANLLGHLPLAIAIAAGRLSSHISIPDYLRELQLADKRLDPLIREDRSVRLSFDISFHAFAPELQQFFITLGTFGGQDFSLEAAVFIGQLSENETDEAIQALVQQSFVQVTQLDRFALHPLIREYAIEKIEQVEAWQRMISYFTSYAQENTYAFSLIDIEESNIVFALDSAHEYELSDYFVDGVLGISKTWFMHGDLTRGISYEEDAVKIAHLHNNKQQEAQLLSILGSTYVQLGQHIEGRIIQEDALQIAYEIDDPELICKLLINLGISWAKHEGDYLQAEAYNQKALPYAIRLENNYLISSINLALGSYAFQFGNNWAAAEQYYQDGLSVLDSGTESDHYTRVALLNSLGAIANERGHNDKAIRYLEECIAISQLIHYPEQESAAVGMLGKIAIEKGEYAQARAYLQKAFELVQGISGPDTIWYSLCYLGVLDMKEGNFTMAASNFKKALQEFRDVQLPWQEATTLINYANSLLLQKQTREAHTLLTKALIIGEEMSSLEIMSWAQFGLARSHTQLGDAAEGIRLAELSYVGLEKLGAIKAKEVKTWLNTQKAM